MCVAGVLCHRPPHRDYPVDAGEDAEYPFTVESPVKAHLEDGSTVMFDQQDLVERYLNANSKLSELSEFESESNRIRSIALEDPKQGIHGEDFTEIVKWFMQTAYRSRSQALSGNRATQLFLRVAIDFKTLSNEPLFAKLSEIYGC